MGKKKAKVGTLTLTGEGQLQVKTDTAILRLGVLTEGKTASEAATENGRMMTRVVSAIRAAGVEEEALKTAGLSISPIIDYDDSPQKNRIVGYRAEDAITAETPVGLAGKVFDDAVAAGANESSNISFFVKDSAACHKRALEAAVAQARADAETVTTAMGKELTAVRSIEVEEATPPIFLRSPARMDRGGSTPVLGGQETLTARVKVVFEYED